MNEKNMCLAVVDMSKNIEQGGFYYSGKAETFDEKKRLIGAMNNPDFRISDMINKVINVVDIYIEQASITNKDTGEISLIPRTVLIDDKGKSYAALSYGVFNSIKKIIGVFGFPDTWEEPIPLEVTRIVKGDRQIYNLIVK